jgi:hypothetical protein
VTRLRQIPSAEVTSPAVMSMCRGYGFSDDKIEALKATGDE